MDVLPDVELGPVADREDADALALVLAGIIEVPELGPLVFGVPAMRGGAEGEDALLGAALFLVAPRAAKGRVEPVEVERLFQPFRFPHVGVERPMVEGIDAPLLGLGILVDQQLHPAFARHPVAQLIHRLKFPGRVDMQQREGRRRGVEGLARQVQHDGAVLAHRIEHHRLFRLRHHFTQDVDALGFESLQMGQGLGIEHGFSTTGLIFSCMPRRPVDLPYGSVSENSHADDEHW